MASAVKLIIDTREKPDFCEYVHEGLKNCEIERQQLDIGDLAFIKGDTYYCIIERKTLNDLAASIKDGRYNEQKVRILNSDFGKTHKHRIYYLLEGDWTQAKRNTKVNGLPTSTLTSAAISMFARDNIKVYMTKDKFETVEFLAALYQKFNDKEFVEKFEHHCPLLGATETPSFEQAKQGTLLTSEYDKYIKAISSKKKGNQDAIQCYLAQLCQIPSVSSKTAQVIMTQYPSMAHLIAGYYQVETDKEREELLRDLVHADSGRKLGMAASKKVYEFLFQV